jgi:SAM-dependent methyltransferase
MATDKSLFHYGDTYHRLLDPLILPARNLIVEQIPQGSEVLDIGCGTGALCFDLRGTKDCRVVGIDLSQKMLDFAQASNTFDDVGFLHADATDLSMFPKNAFDYAVIMNVIHELDSDRQPKMLKEACRVGKVVLLYNSNVPLPWNLSGVVKRAIEVTFGLDHFPQFRSFIGSGGIPEVLASAGLSNRVVDMTVCFEGCNLLATLAS